MRYTITDTNRYTLHKGSFNATTSKKDHTWEYLSWCRVYSLLQPLPHGSHTPLAKIHNIKSKYNINNIIQAEAYYTRLNIWASHKIQRRKKIEILSSGPIFMTLRTQVLWFGFGEIRSKRLRYGCRLWFWEVVLTSNCKKVLVQQDIWVVDVVVPLRFKKQAFKSPKVSLSNLKTSNGIIPRFIMSHVIYSKNSLFY